MSKEDLETLKNKALTESAATFNKWPPMRLGTARPVKFAPFDPHSGYPVRTDGEVLENGDIIFRLYAPEAHSVRVGLGKYNRRVELDLVRRDDGVYEGTMPHNPDFYGFQEVQFYIDGNEALNPHMPVVSGLHRLFNYMELPDPGVPYVLLKDVPHGSINRELYFSKTVGEWAALPCLHSSRLPGGRRVSRRLPAGRRKRQRADLDVQQKGALHS